MKKYADIKLKPEERKALNAFSRRLKKALGRQLVSILLFGSKARGDFSEDSDIDVYILARRRSESTEAKISQVTADILDDYDILISPVSYDLYEEQKNLSMHSFFFEAVKREGIPL
ncbi:MAG: nucleotidyltransferase domain-containing protein [Bacteroidota bacterium]